MIPRHPQTILPLQINNILLTREFQYANSESGFDKRHSYGNVALSFYGNDSNHIPPYGTLWSPNSPILFVDAADTALYVKYVFMETNYDEVVKIADAQSNAIPPTIFTNRSMNTTWECDSFAVIEGGNGTATKITVNVDTSGTKAVLPLPIAPGIDQTVCIFEISFPQLYFEEGP